MALRLYNTLTRTKEVFTPLNPGEVRMYVCGVTVYDLAHVGHARSALVFDAIRRWLIYRGYRVTFVKNFTDVDDKIIRRAQEEGLSASELSERYIAEYQRDMEALGVSAPEVEPKATDHIPKMIALIERLLARGFAYEIDGDVYFEVRRFPRYGRLSGKNLDELLAGARVEVDERKRDPRDFALWKSAKPGELSWKSPWGPGRPGWHIECSAMSMEYLGESFDIHGGGEDLIFPHHECEIAQSETATGKPFVRYWMHNAFVNMGVEKMSKSLGNTLIIKELVNRHNPEAVRLYLLGTHYRNPVEFAEERLREEAQALKGLRALVEWVVDRDREYEYNDLLELHRGGQLGSMFDVLSEDDPLRDEKARLQTRFEDAMDDDFNTPAAVGVLFDLKRELQRYNHAETRNAGHFALGVAKLVQLSQVLGLELHPMAPLAVPSHLRKEIDTLLAQRDAARTRKDWKEADRLREELRTLGVTVEDTPDGSHWRWEPAGH